MVEYSGLCPIEDWDIFRQATIDLKLRHKFIPYRIGNRMCFHIKGTVEQMNAFEFFQYELDQKKILEKNEIKTKLSDNPIFIPGVVFMGFVFIISAVSFYFS